MKRNMFSAAVFLSAGMYIWNNFNFASVMLAVFCVLVYVLWCIFKRRESAAVLAVVSVFVGFCIINFSNEIALSKAKTFDGGEFKIAGKVSDVSETAYGQKFVINHKYKDENGKQKYIKIKAYSNEKVLKYGDVAEFDARLKISGEGGGFGDFNERMNDRSKGILLETTGKIKNLEITGNKTNCFNIYDLGYICQKKVCERAGKFFGGDSLGLVQGLLAGKKENISPEIQENFRISGLSHILVVSGLHVNIILTVLMFVWSLTGMGKSKKTIILSLPAVWFFTVMTGSGVSAVRASIVVSIFLVGKLIKREADSLNSLGIAVLVILFINPANYFSTGFRLSVFSVGGILLFAEKISRKVKFLPRILKEAFAVTISAQLGTLPIVTQSFGNIGIYGILANMIVTPTIIFVMTFAILSLFFGSFFATVTNILLFLMIKIAEIFAKLPFAQTDIRSIEGPRFLIYGVFLASFWFLLCEKRKEAKAAFVPVTVLLCILIGANTFCDKAEVTFLHTGNGDCTILRNKSTVIMFDCGGDEGYNVAKSITEPYMRRQGIGEIDAAFITHYHDDHIKGVAELISMGKVKRVVVPVGIHKKNYIISEAAEKAGIPLHYIGTFDKITLGDIEITAVNTFDGKEENNGMVYFVSYGKNRICISGDVHNDGEKRLTESGADLKCNILKVPHHGSDTSGSREFLKAISPEYAVILRGDSEYPTDEQRNKYKNLGIKLYSVNDCGSIRVNLYKNGKTHFIFGRNNFYELRNIKKTS